MANNTTTPSILLPGLTLLFVYLKLTNQVDWSWFWVLSPTIIPVGLVLSFFACCVVAGLVMQAVNWLNSLWR